MICLVKFNHRLLSMPIGETTSKMRQVYYLVGGVKMCLCYVEYEFYNFWIRDRMIMVTLIREIHIRTIILAEKCMIHNFSLTCFYNNTYRVRDKLPKPVIFVTFDPEQQILQAASAGPFYILFVILYFRSTQIVYHMQIFTNFSHSYVYSFV